jgi:phosphoribosyl 1,2-cyclic phosphodiesterase
MMELRFLGVRGSVAVSGAHAARIGGNTACVEVTSAGHRLVLDAGTGVRALGERLMHEGGPQKATLLFSHLHWDHVQGFPFFAPAYAPTTQLTLYGPGPGGDVALERVLSSQMQAPSFPVPLSAMRSRMRFCEALSGQPLEVGPFRITPFALPHPQGCLGYRIEEGGRAFVYATDVELARAEVTPALGRWMEGADVLCLDAQYTPDEYAGRSGPARRGWGHSTMVDAAQIAAHVDARRLLLFHHDPARTDEQAEEMAEAARTHFAAAEPAREGKVLRLGA